MELSILSSSSSFFSFYCSYSSVCGASEIPELLAKFYEFAKRRKGNKKNIPAIKHCNGKRFTDSVGTASTLNSYNTSVFGCERIILQIKQTHPGETFIINIKMIRKR
jgi:hypothetical protein